MDWRKRDTPTLMLLTVALLAIYAACAGLMAWKEESWLIGAAAVVAVAAAVGSAVLKPWSRYLVYLLTAALFVKMGFSIHAAIDAGYFDTFDSQAAMLQPLVPGAVLACLFVHSCWIVHRQFSKT